MACKNLDHSWECNCEVDGNIIDILVADEDIAGYNGIYGAIPDTDSLKREFNGYIQQYGGLDKVCEVFPYVELELNRYGVFTPVNNNPFSKFSNLYHIMRAKRRDKANEEAEKMQHLQPQSAPAPQLHHNTVPVERVDANAAYTQYLNRGEYIPYDDPRYNSKEDREFAISAANVFVSMDERDKAKKEPVIPFKSAKFIGGNKEEVEYAFNYRKIGSMEPEGGLSNYNPPTDWHPNDPRNYPQEPAPQPQMNYMQFQQQQMQQAPFYNNTCFPPIQHCTPGYVNEDKPGKETFLSLGKLAQDKLGTVGPNAPYKSQLRNPILKTAEFPEGIDRSNPEFERVRAQVSFDCFGPEAALARTTMPRLDPNTTPNNMVDSGDFFLPEMTNEEYTEAMIEQQFGERLRAKIANDNNVAYTSPFSPHHMQAQPNPAQPGVNPYFANNPWTQHNPQMMGIVNPGMAHMMPGFNPGFYHNDNNEWMLPTEEEITSGRAPIVTVTEGEEDWDDCPIVPKKKEDWDDIKVAVVTVHTDENGVEYEEFQYGDIEAVNMKPNVNSLQYKEAAAIAKKNELANDTYLLAKELARYNTELADNLLWYQNNVDLQEFEEIRRDAQLQLIKYRGEDKLSAIKSTVFIAGDRTIVNPGKPTTMEELERIAKYELVSHKTQKDKEEDIINSYCEANRNLNIERKAILKGNSVVDIVTRLQALTDMRILCGVDEIAAYERLNKYSKDMPKVKIDERENYLLWKGLMKGSKEYTGQDTSNFDIEFDEWWNKPRVTTPEQKKEQQEKQHTRLTEMNIEKLTRMVLNAPSPEQIEKRYLDAVLKSWREYDHGVVTPGMGLYEHFDALGYLLSRNVELKANEAANKSSRLYDPKAYLAEVRRHSAIRNLQDGKGFAPTMDLMDQGVYQQKRQDFINQIFKKANRGMIC